MNEILFIFSYGFVCLNGKKWWVFPDVCLFGSDQQQATFIVNERHIPLFFSIEKLLFPLIKERERECSS